MHCPFCGHAETKVIDSRLAGEGRQVRRRRECLECAERFTTFESAELVMPRLIKSDDRREPYDEEKLRAGMTRALEKRPVSAEQIEAAIARIAHVLRTVGERESPARRFQDVEDFREEVERLQEATVDTREQMSLLKDPD